MRRKFIFLLVAVGISGTSAAQAQDASQFDGLKRHLLAGQRTTSILQLEKCEQTSGTRLTAKNLTGGFVIPSFMNVQEPSEAIVYADDHSTVRENMPVHEFIRYRVMADETAVITTTTFSSKSFELIGETKTFKCKLGDGLRFAYQPE